MEKSRTFVSENDTGQSWWRRRQAQILQALHVEAQTGQVVRLLHVADGVPGGHQFLVGPQQVRAGRVHPASVLIVQMGPHKGGLGGGHTGVVQRDLLGTVGADVGGGLGGDAVPSMSRSLWRMVPV